MNPFYTVHQERGCTVLRMASSDGTNKLGLARVLALNHAVDELAATAGGANALVITGTQHFFSAGADLHEITQLTGPAALEFARSGQGLMRSIDRFPAPVIAAVHGYCMGGGLDLALACDFRIASPGAVFGHRGAALGLMTGWGGTQRLPRLIGRARALEIFILAEKISAAKALQMGLLNRIAGDPVQEALSILAQ